MKHIQFSRPNLKADNEDLIAIKEIIDNGWFCESKYIKQLENRFKEITGNKYAIPCSSCTQGLVIAFKAADIKNKDVAVQSFTWPSILFALESTNNRPLWCDINENSWLLDNVPSFVFREIGAIVITDTFGNQAEFETDLPLIVDAAHGYNLPKLGKRGLIEVISFSFTKKITGMQGGCLLTDDYDVYVKAWELIRLSCKMLEIEAYYILKQMNIYEEQEVICNRIINKYRDLIKIPYKEQSITTSNHSVFAILFENSKIRDTIKNSFEKNNIEVKIYYEPLERGLPKTEDIFSRILALPVYESMESEVERICNLINNI